MTTRFQGTHEVGKILLMGCDLKIDKHIIKNAKSTMQTFAVIDATNMFLGQQNKLSKSMPSVAANTNHR